MENIFLQLSIILSITVAIAFVMRLLRQPLMSAYIVAGILSGPVFLNVLHGKQDVYHTLSQLGVVLLLFAVGLNLNFEHLKKIGKASLIAGVSQVIFTGTIGTVILLLLGFSVVSAVYLAVAITFSSTIIIVKLLADKKDMETTYGRYTVGLMIVQDVIAIIVMLVVTTFVGSGGAWHMLLSMFLLKCIALIAMVYFLGRFLLPRLLDNIAKSGEFLFIFTLTWCFGVASLLQWLGFSLEMGAIAAGLSLGSSPYQQEISSRIRPLKDFFIVLFFIILGSEMTLANVGTALLPATILSLFILFGNPFILYQTFRWLKFTRRNSFLAGLTAAQVSEFGFVLLLTGVGAGHILGEEIGIFTIVALITIFGSSYVVTYGDRLYQWLQPLFLFFGKDKYQQREERPHRYDVYVFGYHRLGWKICEGLQKRGVSFAVVDFNPATLVKLKQNAIPAYYGDAADIEFLETLALDKAKMVISTIPAPDDELMLIKHVRTVAPRARVVATLYHTETLGELYQAGADYVMLPHLLGGTWMADVLKEQKWTKKVFDQLRTEQVEEMKLRHMQGTVQ